VAGEEAFDLVHLDDSNFWAVYDSTGDPPVGTRQPG